MILGDWEYTALQKPDGSFAEDDSAQGTAIKLVQHSSAHTLMYHMVLPHSSPLHGPPEHAGVTVDYGTAYSSCCCAQHGTAYTLRVICKRDSTA